ncbi:MAG TPA: hypothetical protein VHR45_00290 [Thermoanaerobaculia bacterium]|nr:hypothetical protein [Thermoanaerobaculia bacterium]
MKRSASAGRSSKPSRSSARHEISGSPARSYVICVRNEDYPASLERGKVYLSFGAPQIGPQGYLVVVDESGEEYLYPASYFHAIELPQEVEEALALL